MNYLSPSKVNLGLRIVGRTENGYHQLESLFWPIDLCDEIQLQRADETSVSMEWDATAAFSSSLPARGEDSVSKLLAAHPELGKWKIRIKKRIPIGGGLGGSSSNVGTVLRVFTEQGVVHPATAQKLALQRGADVPFFLNPVPSWVTGIGEQQSPIGTSVEVRLFLFVFEEPCITKDVFENFRTEQIPFSRRTDLPLRWSAENLWDYLSLAKNDLEKVVVLKRQDIRNCLEFLASLKPLYSGLSGSGSTCFAVSNSDAAQEIISQEAWQFCRKSNCKLIEVNTFRA